MQTPGIFPLRRLEKDCQVTLQGQSIWSSLSHITQTLCSYPVGILIINQIYTCQVFLNLILIRKPYTNWFGGMKTDDGIILCSIRKKFMHLQKLMDIIVKENKSEPFICIKDLVENGLSPRSLIQIKGSL